MLEEGTQGPVFLHKIICLDLMQTQMHDGGHICQMHGCHFTPPPAVYIGFISVPTHYIQQQQQKLTEGEESEGK